MGEVHLRKYGAGATVDFDLFEVDGVDFRVDAVHASGDTVIMKDEGAEANTTNGFVDEGSTYSIALSAAEMQAARVKIIVIDQTATKAWLDRSITIETYGHASAQHAFDLDTATVTTDTASRTASKADVSAVALETTLTDMKGATFNANTDALDEIGAVTSGLATAQNIADTVRTEMEEAGSNLDQIHNKLPSKSYLRGTADADGGMDTADKADINTEADSALSDIHLDHLLAADYNPASKPGNATALLNELVEDDAGVSRYTVNALENGPSGTGASAAVIADAVWDELQSDHVTAGRFGEIATEIAAIPTDKTGYALSAAGIDSIHNEVMEGTTTLRQAIRLILSVLTGKSSGGGTATLVFRDIGDTKNRISATVDANGNRSAVGTRDGS